MVTCTRQCTAQSGIQRRTALVEGRQRGRLQSRCALTRRAWSDGFTIVELLVVIAITGILVALLLPAVQAAREAARRIQCRNNLKQLALALHSYEQALGTLPPASFWYQIPDMDVQNNSRYGANWVILILPFLENGPLYDSFDLGRSIADPANRDARGTSLPVMLCPSDSAANQVPFAGKPGSAYTSNFGDNWARGNYGANSGLGFQSQRYYECHTMNLPGWTCGGPPALWQDWRIRGVMGANASSRMEDITDGTSNTIMLAELRAGIVSFDPRGTWAMSGGGPSSIWNHGFLGDANGPNAMQIYADQTPECAEIQNAVGGAAALQRLGMPCYTAGGPSTQAAPRSRHPGGVYAAFCDGSVHWISDAIEKSPDMSHFPNSVWDYLNLSQDSRVISANALGQ